MYTLTWFFYGRIPENSCLINNHQISIWTKNLGNFPSIPKVTLLGTKLPPKKKFGKPIIFPQKWLGMEGDIGVSKIGVGPKLNGLQWKTPINPWMIWGVSTPLFSETSIKTLLLMVQKYVWVVPFRWESQPRRIRVIPVVDKPAGWGCVGAETNTRGLKTRGDECSPQELIEI